MFNLLFLFIPLISSFEIYKKIKSFEKIILENNKYELL